MDFLTCFLLILAAALILFGIGMSAWVRMFPAAPSSQMPSPEFVQSLQDMGARDEFIKALKTSPYREPAVKSEEQPRPDYSFYGEDTPVPPPDVPPAKRGPGPKIIEEGPSTLVAKCDNCITVFSYTLEDCFPSFEGSQYKRVSCPKCGFANLHVPAAALTYARLYEQK